MTKTFVSIAIFTVLLVVGQSTGRPHQVASSSLPQIQSSGLRIQFDENMRSRVVARMKSREVLLGGFSASETVRVNERSWYYFALTSQSHERVTGNFGGGERLTLTGTSGVLRKNLSVIIYDEFPNLAVFDVSYTNIGKSQLKILEWSNN